MARVLTRFGNLPAWLCVYSLAFGLLFYNNQFLGVLNLVLSKRKLYYLSFLIAFLILCLIIMVLNLIGNLFDIPWLINFCDNGMLVGNITGVFLGFKVIFDGCLFKKYFAVSLLLIALGIFVILVNAYSVFIHFA